MNLDKQRTRLELMRVTTARMELEFKIEERKEEIKRMEDHIKIQIDKELELNQKIKDMEKGE